VAGDLLFPVGFTGTTAYTPNTINVSAATTYGKITVRPVSGAHPNLPTASAGQSLAYYWRVTSTGFAIGVGTVNHKSYDYGMLVLFKVLLLITRLRDMIHRALYGLLPLLITASGKIIYPATFTFNFGTNIDGEYTSGDILNNASVAIFYSRQTGAWNLNTTWSASPCAGTCGGSLPAGTTAGVNFPGPNNPVVIGNASNFHVVTIDADNRSSGSLYIETGSTLDCNTRIGLNFGPNAANGVTGRGTLKISAITAGLGVFPGGDFTNFIGPSGGTVEWYGNTKTLPSNGPAPNNLVLDNYYSLKINPTAGQTITMPSSNLTIYGNLTVNDDGDGGTVQTDNALSRAITLNGNFSVSNGTFSIRTNAGNTVTSTFSLTSSLGNLTVASGTTLSVVAGGSATHSLTTYGNIVNNGTIDFKNGSVVNLIFKGATNNSFGGTNAGASTTINFLTLDKGVDQSATLTMDFLGTMPTAPPNNWLTLLNGTFSFANSLTYTIQGNAATYSIPSTAKLKVQSGTVNILSNGSNAADLLLSGGLEVSGGTAIVGSAGGDFNNDIEYASSVFLQLPSPVREH
jgi:hypothetical protein